MPTLQASIYGAVRGLISSLSGAAVEGEVPLAGTGEQLVAAGLPPYQEIVRQGRSYNVLAAAAVAALAAEPTTVALLTLHNLEPDGGKSYVIDAINAIQVGAPATLGSFGLRYCVGRDRVAPITGSLTPKGLMGQPYGGAGLVAVGQTIVNDGWFPLGGSINTALVSVPGCQVDVPVEGRIIIRPGRQLNIHVVASATGLTFLAGCRWHEIPALTA